MKASLVSPEYLDSMEETIYTLTHSMDDIKKAKEEIARGEYVTLEEMEKEFQKRQARRKKK